MPKKRGEKMQLDEKYVFHIPLFKYANGELVSINICDLVEDLISKFGENGFENLYIVKSKGFYKSRSYDELLITIYTTSNNSPDQIFKRWFKENNDILQQEALAYENNNRMFIENLI